MNDPKAQRATEKRTVIEEGTQFKGSLTSTCAILVQGSVKGDIEGPALTVSPTGSVSGVIVTQTLSSAGTLAGELDVDTAEISGRVEHNTVVRATSLDVKLAAPAGKLELTFGPGPHRSGR